MNINKEYTELLLPPENATPNWFRQRGFKFERILNELLKREGLEPRSGYKPEGEQIDGSFFLDGAVFLLEAKWHKDELPASSIYQFKGKVDGKLLGTIGIFISMSGYSNDAVDALTLGKSLNVILFGKDDIDSVIIHNKPFKNILKSKLRKAAEEGIVYLPIESEQVTKEGVTKIENYLYDGHSTKIVKNEGVDEMDTDLVIICEGKTDSDIISFMSTKILNQLNSTLSIKIIVAMGKLTIPKVANSVFNLNYRTPVLIVADSDSDTSKTIDLFKRNIDSPNWNAAIPDPEIETWLGFKDRHELKTKFRKRGDFRTEIKRIIEETDIEKLAGENEAFGVFYKTIKEPNTVYKS